MGRPRGISNKLDSSYRDKREYNHLYRQQYRYIFSINLNQDTDADIIEALESRGVSRQQALKELLRLGIAYEIENSAK